MHETLAVANAEQRGVQADLSAEIHAALALSRATLQALAALSDAAQAAAETALEDEADRAAPGARGIVEDARDRMQRAPAEARLSLAIRQALVAAADALPSACVA
ncbi:hypothetical protein [Phenylobacterium sp.]|uniref:hypothetical protein n=1 Tax=Phenylobacterium sp. TaxID=1871053 RepID=UPI002F41272A